MASAPVWKETTWWDLAFAGRPTVAVIGAGGKTTALRRFGKEAARTGRNITLTTSTRMAADQVSVADRHLPVIDGIPGYLPEGSVLITRPRDFSGQKLQGLDAEEIDWLAHAHPDRALAVEADGGRDALLKVPGENEPVIPSCVGTVIAITSIQVLDEVLTPGLVHRWSRCQEILGCEEGDTLGPELMARLLGHPQGSFFNCSPGVRRVWLVNKADTAEDKSRAAAFIDAVMEHNAGGFDEAAYGSLAWERTAYVRV